MTFNANIPQSTDLISNSQPQILANFSQLNTQFAVDHNAFNTGSGNGNGHHKKVFFDNAPVAPTVAGTESAIYPGLVSAAQQLFFKNAVGAVQLTGTTVASASGSTFLPGGIILKWGTGAITGSTQTFPVAFPNNAYSMIVVGSATSYTGGFVVSALSTTNFTVSRTSGSGNTGYYYIAIGN